MSNYKTVKELSDKQILAAERKVIDDLLAEVKAEMIRAIHKHGPMKTAHEAFGVIYEEFNIEYGAAMHANDAPQCRKELIQVAAMASRTILDVFNGR